MSLSLYRPWMQGSLGLELTEARKLTFRHKESDTIKGAMFVPEKLRHFDQGEVCERQNYIITSSHLEVGVPPSPPILAMA